MDAQQYMLLLEKAQVLPNFWTSEEYLRLSPGIQIWQEGDYVFVGDTDLPDFLLLPPIHATTGQPSYVGTREYWSDFGNVYVEALADFMIPDFLDYQFVYDPRKFLNIKGRAWSAFRKNVAKAHTRYGLDTVSHVGFLDRLAIYVDWKEAKVAQDPDAIQDEDSIVAFLEYGKNAEGIIDAEGRIVAVNIWDSNHLYHNYRYSFVRAGYDHLSEYARYSFYIHRAMEPDLKFVNDGGSLGSDSLYVFKKKLHPTMIREVFSWKPRR